MQVTEGHCTLETKLPEGSEWHEEAIVDIAAVDKRHGSRAVSTSWYVRLSRKSSTVLTNSYRESRWTQLILLLPVSITVFRKTVDI